MVKDIISSYIPLGTTTFDDRDPPWINKNVKWLTRGKNEMFYTFLRNEMFYPCFRKQRTQNI